MVNLQTRSLHTAADEKGKMLCRTTLQALSIAVLFIACAEASAWNRVGTFKVGEANDVDIISLPDGKMFSRIKLCASGNAVRFYSATIYFKDGGQQTILSHYRLDAGSCTRSTDVVGVRRDISRIRLVYEDSILRKIWAEVSVFLQ